LAPAAVRVARAGIRGGQREAARGDAGACGGAVSGGDGGHGHPGALRESAAIGRRLEDGANGRVLRAAGAVVEVPVAQLTQGTARDCVSNIAEGIEHASATLRRGSIAALGVGSAGNLRQTNTRNGRASTRGRAALAVHHLSRGEVVLTNDTVVENVVGRYTLPGAGRVQCRGDGADNGLAKGP